MATTPDRILVPGRAEVWIAPTSTVAPVDPSATPGTGWIDVGLFTDDSLSFSTDPNFEDVTSAQSDFPTRRFQTSDAASIEVDLQEWSTENLVAAFGGGTVAETSVGSGIWKYTPPRLGSRVEKACLIKITDGTKYFEFIFPRVMQTEGMSTDLQKGGEATIPLRLDVLGGDATDAWTLLVKGGGTAFTATA